MRVTTILSIFLIIIISGCSEIKNSPKVKPFYDMIIGYEVDMAMLQEKTKNIPYASLYAQMGRGMGSVMVLAEIDPNNNLLWVSADRVHMITKNGRMIKITGLPINLLHTQFLREDFFNQIVFKDHKVIVDSQKEYLRQVDFSIDNRYGRLIKSYFVDEGLEDLVMGSQTFHTQRIREFNVLEETEEQFENVYWFDISGNKPWLVRSEQIIELSLPPLVSFILKPPSLYLD